MIADAIAQAVDSFRDLVSQGNGFSYATTSLVDRRSTLRTWCLRRNVRKGSNQMANQIIPVAPQDLIIIASGSEVRALTVFGSEDTKQMRNGVELVQLRATVLLRGQTLGEVALQTSKADFSSITSGDILMASGEGDVKFAGTNDDWGLRVTVYAQVVHPSGINAWTVAADAIKNRQAAAK
jgi:hypothetical protein